MKYINSYKLFEGKYEIVRANNSELEDKFKHYDKVIEHLNALYDNVKIKHRGNKFYDIYYTMGGDQNKNTIHIGVYSINITDSGKPGRYILWECDKLSDYSPQGIDDYKTQHYYEEELNEESFDRFVNRWYDIYDSL